MQGESLDSVSIQMSVHDVYTGAELAAYRQRPALKAKHGIVGEHLCGQGMIYNILKLR